MAQDPTTDSRIADASLNWQGACDVDVTDWNKANSFVLATYGYDDRLISKEEQSAWKLQWREDGGSWNDLTGSGNCKWATDTVLVHKTSPVITPSNCQITYDSVEIEGFGDFDDKKLKLEHSTFGELQWAITVADGSSGVLYEFQLVNVTWSSSAICSCSLTTAIITARESRSLARSVVLVALESRALARTVQVITRESRSLSRTTQISVRVSRSLARTVQLADRVSRSLVRNVIVSVRESRSLARVVQVTKRESRSLERTVQRSARQSRSLDRIVQRTVRVSRSLTRDVVLTNRVSRSLARTVQIAAQESRSLARIVQRFANESRSLERCVLHINRISRSFTRSVTREGVGAVKIATFKLIATKTTATKAVDLLKSSTRKL